MTDDKLAYELARAHEALIKIKEYNHIHNDLEAYLFHVAEWGLGTREERPDPKSFGLPEAAEQAAAPDAASCPACGGEMVSTDVCLICRYIKAPRR